MFNQPLNFNFNANRSLNNGMPNMAETLTGWEIPLTLTKVKQKVVDGLRQDEKTSYNFLGVWQPLRDEQLQFKPEGQRSWEWIWLHAKPGSLNLQTQDLIIFNNKNYKIMSVKDYSLNGYIEYELVRDYQQM